MTRNFELSTYSRDDLMKDMQWLYGNNTNVRKENNAATAKGGAK
jgi:NADH-quinone oxidoreductase subunit I